MATCPYCKRVLTLPPSIDLLSNSSLQITPNYTLDRNIARCRVCDLMTANKRAIDVELSSPSHKNPVTEIEQQIKVAQSLIRDGIRKDELEGALPQMKDKWKEAITQRDRSIREAWSGYWAIWGLEKGQDGT